MSIPASFRLRPLSWAFIAILATTFAVSGWVTPHKTLLPSSWHSGDISTVLPARIKPSVTFGAASDLSGKVISVLVTPGTQVQPGQVLATVESEDLNTEIDRARRRVKFAESRIAALRPAGRRGAAQRLQAERYQNALHARKAARERLGGYSVADMDKMLQQARTRTAQIRSLMEQQLATSAELDEAMARERDASSGVKAAREHWSRLKQEADLADSQLRLAKTDTSSAGNADALLSAQLELEDARESLRQVQGRAKGKNVVANRGGTVLRADIHTGDRVGAGEVLFQIADVSELNFEVPITAGMAEQVHPGRPVVVRIPTDPPRSQPAAVSSVLLSPDQDHPSYIVRITIPNPNPAAILAGLEGAVEFPHMGSKWKLRPSY